MLSLHHIPTSCARLWDWHTGTGGCCTSSAKEGGNVIMLICLIKWGNFFFSVNFILLLFVALWVLLFSAHLFHRNHHWSWIPIPIQTFTRAWCFSQPLQEGTKCISLTGKNIRRSLLLEPEQAASSWLGGSWGIDSGLFEVSLAMTSDFYSRYCFLPVLCSWG